MAASIAARLLHLSVLDDPSRAYPPWFTEAESKVLADRARAITVTLTQLEAAEAAVIRAEDQDRAPKRARLDTPPNADFARRCVEILQRTLEDTAGEATGVARRATGMFVNGVFEPWVITAAGGFWDLQGFQFDTFHLTSELATLEALLLTPLELDLTSPRWRSPRDWYWLDAKPTVFTLHPDNLQEKFAFAGLFRVDASAEEVPLDTEVASSSFVAWRAVAPVRLALLPILVRVTFGRHRTPVESSRLLPRDLQGLGNSVRITAAAKEGSSWWPRAPVHFWTSGLVCVMADPGAGIVRVLLPGGGPVEEFTRCCVTPYLKSGLPWNAMVAMDSAGAVRYKVKWPCLADGRAAPSLRCFVDGVSRAPPMVVSFPSAFTLED